MCNDGVRMRNGIGKRESSWTRVTMVCACGMGLGSERAHGCEGVWSSYQD
jgi:hypothetical protein